MKTFNKLIILSIFVVINMSFFASVAQAGDPNLIIQEPIVGQYVIDDQNEPLVFEPIPFEPIPYDPDDPYTTDPSIEVNLEMEEIPGGRVSLNWNRYDGPNFQYYKILHSTEDNNLYYPMTPEIDYFDDQNKTGYIHNDPDIGDNFYRICVITSDDKRGCSNVQFVFKPEPIVEEGVLPETPSEVDSQKEVIPPNEEMQPRQPEERQPEEMPNKVVRPTFLQRIGKYIVGNLGTIIAIVTVLIAISGFTFAAKRKQKSISKYINQIDDTYSEYKMKAKRCEAELYRLKDIVDDQLKTGKIDEGAYQLLMGRIEGYMIDIQKQIVNEKFGGLPATMKDQMFKMMEDGEITEAEFEAMQTLIKRSELSASEKDSLLETVKDFKKQDEVLKKKGRRE